MSIYDHKEPLNEEQQNWLRERIKQSAEEEVNEVFSEADKELASEGYLQLEKVYNEFLRYIFDQATNREPLNEVDRLVWVEKMAEALQGFYNSATDSDDRMLHGFMETDPEEARDSIEQLAEDIESLEAYLEQDLDEQERTSIELDLHELYAQAEIYRANVKNGFWRAIAPTITNSAPLTEKERQAHLKNVCEFKGRQVEKFDAKKIAESLVDEYNRQLVSHKIFTGVLAKYSDQEIIAHLQQVFPDRPESEFKVEIDSWRESVKENHPKKISELQAYTRIIKMVYGDRPISALAFAGGAGLLGGLAPMMGQYLGEFGRTGDKGTALLAGGFGILSTLGQVELDRRLGLFMNERMNGEVGIGHQLFDGVMGSSPELFQKKDLAWVRQYADETRKNIEDIAESTVTDIGARLSRIVFLTSAMAMRLENPALFLPCMVATLANVGLALHGDKEIGDAGWETRQAAAEFTSLLDKAMEVRATRGHQSSASSEIMWRVEVAQKKFLNTMAKYKAMGGFVMPVILVGNALLSNTQDPDWRGNFLEASIYSSQLSQESTELIKQISRIRQSLKPIIDFANTLNEFRESGQEVPTAWRVEFRDIKLEKLETDHLVINPGDLMVLVGRSGTSKSKLLRALYGFSLDRGLMNIDGYESNEVDIAAYREKIMLINQFYAIENKSLRDNVISGDLPVDEEVLRQSIAQFDFNEILNDVNDVRKQPYGDPVSEMIFNKDIQPSGGEVKLFSMIAVEYRLRVLPDSVKMIIIDEPTSGVDEITKRHIFETIARWRATYPDKTMVIINHDKQLFEYLPPETRILGFEKRKSITQDETLAEARLHPDSPFGKLFGSTVAKA